MDKNLRGYLAELFGTFALVFVGAGAVCANQLAIEKQAGPNTPYGSLGLLGIAVASGCALAAGLAATLPLSGGFLNPAVTVALWACKRLDGAKATALIFVQLLGAAIAGGVLRLAFSQQILIDSKLGTPHVNVQAFGADGITNWTNLRGVAVETALTFILTFVIFATTVDPRTPKLLGRTGRWLIGLWVGLALTAVTLVGFNVTGAATNPARWFGTVVWEKTISALAQTGPFGDSPVYWIGPILGAILAGGAYTLLVMPPDEERAAEAAAHAEGKVPVGVGSTLFRAKK